MSANPCGQKPKPASSGCSRAKLARETVGLTLEQAAKRARITPQYLMQVERKGASFSLAQRLSRLYDCRIDFFLPS